MNENEIKMVEDFGRIKLYAADAGTKRGYKVTRYELEGKTYEIKDWIKRFFADEKIREHPRWDAEKKRWVFVSRMSLAKVINSIDAKLRRMKIEKEAQHETKKIAEREENYTQEEKDVGDLLIERWCDITVDYDIKD